MALRFRTRLNLTIVSLVFLVVTVMTLVVVVIFALDMASRNWQQGAVLTQVTTRNIEYGLAIPYQVESHLRSQMLAQAFLADEFVALGQRSEAVSAEDLSAALQRVIDRVSEHGAQAFISDYTVTDAEGHPIISTQEAPTLPEALIPLLESANPPVSQLSTAPGDTGDSYVGISATNGSGVVHVTANRSAIDTMRSFFSVQQLAERFMLPDQYWGIAIVDSAGNIVAEAGELQLDETPRLRARMLRVCENFLRSPPSEGIATDYTSRQGGIGWDVEVVSALRSPTGEISHALYVLHNGSRQFIYILDRLGVLIVVGLVLFMISLIVTIFLTRGLSRPLVALSQGAREFGSGNFNYRLRMKRKDEFNDLAQSFNTMAISIQEYVHELEQETSRRERLEGEFRFAADLQRTLLPETPPVLEGLSLNGWSQPSKEVGGDFYDYIEMDDGRVAVVLGDATGKGLTAALLSTQCSSILGTLANQGLSTSELLYQTNNAFYKRIGTTHRFVTLLIMVIDTNTGKATYASAGHPPPLIVNPDSPEARWLESEAGYPLGIIAKATFSETEIQLKPGDTVVIYSDGLTDARNHAKEMYGDERIKSTVQTSSGSAGDQLLQDLRDDAVRYMAGEDPMDDMTIVVIGYNPSDTTGLTQSNVDRTQ